MPVAPPEIMQSCLPVGRSWCVHSSSQRRSAILERHRASSPLPLILAEHTDFRFGSLADITARSRHVRFTPDSGHSSLQVGCPLSARSRHKDFNELQAPSQAVSRSSMDLNSRRAGLPHDVKPSFLLVT